MKKLFKLFGFAVVGCLAGIYRLQRRALKELKDARAVRPYKVIGISDRRSSHAKKIFGTSGNNMQLDNIILRL